MHLKGEAYPKKTDPELFHPGYALAQRSCKRVFTVLVPLLNYKVTKPNKPIPFVLDRFSTLLNYKITKPSRHSVYGIQKAENQLLWVIAKW